MPTYTDRNGIIFSDETEGAVSYDDCPTRDRWKRCRCPVCMICGHAKHTAVHGPAHGQPPGSKPWGHAWRRVTALPAVFAGKA